MQVKLTPSETFRLEVEKAHDKEIFSTIKFFIAVCAFCIIAVYVSRCTSEVFSHAAKGVSAVGIAETVSKKP